MAQKNEPVRGCVAARTISGNSPMIVYWPQGRTTDYNTAQVAGIAATDGSTSTGLPKAGAMVYKNASNMIRNFPGKLECTQYDTAATYLIGLLLEDVAGAGADTTANNKVAIAAAVPDTIFETALFSRTATTTATTTASLIGLCLTASVNGSRFYLSRTGTDSAALRSSCIFRVVAVPSDNGTLNGRVQFVCRRSIFIDTSVVV